jgi:hypothetical protein
MKTPTQFVEPLTEEQRERLKEILKSQSPQRNRMRAPAILLSERRYSIDQIADLYQGDRDRVSQGLDWGEEYQVDGLADDPRSGRPPQRTAEGQKRAGTLTLTGPRARRQGLTASATRRGKTLSRAPLPRILQADRRWMGTPAPQLAALAGGGGVPRRAR